jgi:tetratricopeptide (TPR) repeat protein
MQPGAAAALHTAKSPPESGDGSVSLARLQLLCGGAVFGVALLLYAWTLAPTVTCTDSGELIVVARHLGIAHPPGVPLWILLAHLASLAPIGNVAVRINFSSAFFAALACAMLALTAAEMAVTASYLNVTNRAKKASRQWRGPKDQRETQLSVVTAALGAGFLMAFSRTLWSYAVIAEVYALNTLLIGIVLFLMCRWRRCIVADAVPLGPAKRSLTSPNPSHDLLLYAAAFVFGLALGVHHVTVGLILPAVAVIVYRTQGWQFFTSKRLLYAALISVAALVTIYAYLPLAASRSPVINWGNPRLLREIWWHVTGRQYRVYFTFMPELVGKQLAEFWAMTLREFGFPWLPLALALALGGMAIVFRRDRTAFWFLLVLIVADLAYGISYEIAEDKDAYYLPAFISLALAAAFGMQWLVQRVASRGLAAVKPALASVIAVASICGIALCANWRFNNRRQYFIASDYAENLLSTIRPNGLLLTLDWQVASPMFYVQQIEQRRRDVKVLDVNLLRRSWYFDYLSRSWPGLVQRSSKQIESFVQNLREWERDPDAFKKSAALTERITAAFLSMLEAIVTNESRVGPVYITSDLLFTDSMNGEFTRWLTHNYQLVPEGLVFTLTDERDFHDLPALHLQTRGLADGTIRFEQDDPVKVKILPAYTRMLVNRGRYLASFGQHERAVAAFRQALDLDPNFAPAKQGLAESAAKLRKQ